MPTSTCCANRPTSDSSWRSQLRAVPQMDISAPAGPRGASTRGCGAPVRAETGAGFHGLRVGSASPRLQGSRRSRVADAHVDRRSVSHRGGIPRLLQDELRADDHRVPQHRGRAGPRRGPRRCVGRIGATVPGRVDDYGVGVPTRHCPQVLTGRVCAPGLRSAEEVTRPR